MNIEQATVKLGHQTCNVVPQPLPYLKHELGPTFEKLTASDVDRGNLLAFASANAYELLKVFIPDLMPQHEWEGFATPEALEAGAYDEATARRLAPTFAEIKTAFEAVVKINGFDLWKALGKLVDPTALRAIGTKALFDSISKTSPSSSLEDLGSPSSTSSMTDVPELLATPSA